MKTNPFDKTLRAKTGKDILHLFNSKKKNGTEVKIQLPEGEVETALFSIWSNLLGHENFGVNDDFFLIGGNSLKGIQLISRISGKFTVDIQLTDIFLYTTITQQAGFIETLQKSNKVSSKIKPSIRPERIPLSFSQERLWFLDK